MKKQVLVSVDRGETRVALLEATGDVAPQRRSGRRRRRSANPAAGYRVAELYLERRGSPACGVVAILFYRAHWMSRNLGFVDALVRGLEAEGCTPLAIFCQSLKGGPDGVPVVFRDYLLDANGAARVDAVLNTLSFAMSQVEVKGVTRGTRVAGVAPGGVR